MSTDHVDGHQDDQVVPLRAEDAATSSPIERCGASPVPTIRDPQLYKDDGPKRNRSTGPRSRQIAVLRRLLATPARFLPIGTGRPSYHQSVVRS